MTTTCIHLTKNRICAWHYTQCRASCLHCCGTAQTGRLIECAGHCHSPTFHCWRHGLVNRVHFAAAERKKDCLKVYGCPPSPPHPLSLLSPKKKDICDRTISYMEVTFCMGRAKCTLRASWCARSLHYISDAQNLSVASCTIMIKVATPRPVHAAA